MIAILNSILNIIGGPMWLVTGNENLLFNTE